MPLYYSVQMSHSITCLCYFADITQLFINFRSLKDALEATAAVTPVMDGWSTSETAEPGGTTEVSRADS